MKLCSLTAIIVAAIVAPALSAACHAQTPGCLNLPGEPHPYGSQQFITNSRVAPPNLDGYQRSVISCVTHDDKINPLRVKWVIPGPDGWVPPGKTLDSLPRDTNLASFAQLPGCLLFGNRGDITQGQFLGIEGDSKRVDAEKARGCRAVVADPNPVSSKIVRALLKFLNYVPTDADNAKKTMMQISGTVAIEPQGDSGYRSVVTYAISRYEDSDGNPSELSMRPAFAGATEQLLPAFSKEHESVSRLREEGEITFEVGDIRNPVLDYAAYEILDRKGRPVGSVSFPVFVPAPQ